jgi:hypothetical protein
MTDKKLRSKVGITFNDGLLTQKTSVITGKITAVAYPKFDHVAVRYTYSDADGNVIKSDVWEIVGATEINQMFTDIEPLLPPAVSEVQDMIEKFYIGFMHVAATTWNNDLGDWEIVDDIAV